MRTSLEVDAAGCALADPAIAQVAQSKLGEKFGEFESPLRQPHFRLLQLADDLLGCVSLLTHL